MGRGAFSSHPRYHLPKKRNNDSSQNPTLQTPSSPKHPGTDAGEDPHHQSRANVRLSADVVTGWSEGNHSPTPVRAPSHTSTHHPPPCRGVVHLPSNSPKSLCFYFPLLHHLLCLLTSDSHRITPMDDMSVSSIRLSNRYH